LQAISQDSDFAVRQEHQGIDDEALQRVRQIILGHHGALPELIHHPEHAMDLDAGVAGAAAQLLVACQEDPIWAGLGQPKLKPSLADRPGWRRRTSNAAAT
jgi:hypothetical protein